VPSATQIVDNGGAVWTLAGNGAILRNAVQAGGGWGSQILWRSGAIYVFGNDRNWWQWTGAGWTNVGAATPGGGGTTSPSADGTTVPSATQIVDNTGVVWTIGGGGAILRNGIQASGGFGSQILWKSGAIYVFGTDRNWYQWTGGGWTNLGPTMPGGGSSGSTTSPSPDGTTVPSATQIVDNTGAVWTIGSGGAILRNSVQASAGFGSQILWKSSTIYVFGTDRNWWKWTGAGWSNVGPTTPGGSGTTSPDGTTVPSAAQIVDNTGAVWTIGSYGVILRNGIQPSGGVGSQILWKSSTIYVCGTDGSWWKWTGSGWTNVGGHP
jgi:hypothetical protein